MPAENGTSITRTKQQINDVFDVLSSLVKNVPMLTSLRMSPFCVFLWSRCRPTGGRSGLGACQ
jgi:hypothetical protein